MLDANASAEEAQPEQQQSSEELKGEKRGRWAKEGGVCVKGLREETTFTKALQKKES